MQSRLKNWLPELAITAILLFFALRELGTFPAAWADEGLFLIVAKMIAAGKGYVLPLLNDEWAYPYFLNVGPTLIYPPALFIRLFGLSVTVARIPMVLYLLGATLLFYLFTLRTLGRRDARWATLLLVTFSAFINTGKPMLGEIPAMFFLLGGLLMLEKSAGWKRTVGSGLLFGLAFLSKITFGLILPALGVAWLRAAYKREWREVGALTCIGLLTVLTYLPWRILEIAHTEGGSLAEEFSNFLLGSGGESTFMYVLRFERSILLTLPFLAFVAFLILGAVGFWHVRKKLTRSTGLVIVSMIALFLLYYLNGFGWYRLLLPGHLLLLPFVPAGAAAILGKRGSAALLSLLVLAQGYWQFSHHGSSQSTEGPEAAAYVMEKYADRDLVIEPTEVFARLPVNEHWKFIMPRLSFSMPAAFSTLSGAQCRMPLLRKIGAADQDKTGSAKIEPVARRYVILRDYPCPYTPQ